MCSPYFGIACEEGMAIVSSMKRVLHAAFPSAAKKAALPTELIHRIGELLFL